ncbi:hypothetical protein V1477_010676 [Vespula maculifrons]|uniref:Uncharacterized protein n=1 Tax=Vespula maculifrons TaxID=7453 RepID=A0ABD2C2M9_VESMC
MLQNIAINEKYTYLNQAFVNFLCIDKVTLMNYVSEVIQSITSQHYIKSTKDDNEEDKDEYLYNDNIFDNHEYELTAFIIVKNSYEV